MQVLAPLVRANQPAASAANLSAAALAEWHATVLRLKNDIGTWVNKHNKHIPVGYPLVTLLVCLAHVSCPAGGLGPGKGLARVCSLAWGLGPGPGWWRLGPALTYGGGTSVLAPLTCDHGSHWNFCLRHVIEWLGG